VRVAASRREGLKRAGLRADTSGVKGLEKLTFIRLAEVLSQTQAVGTDAITDALYAADAHGEPFPDVLVSAGAISEWDLAKLVVEHFQLPFLMAGHHALNEEALKRIPEADLFRLHLVPLDAFDHVVTVSMPILTPFEQIDRLQKTLEIEIFPYVGLVSENRKLLKEQFAAFTAWHEDQQKKREVRRGQPKKNTPGDWASIFDTGDQAVLHSLGRRKG